MMDQKSQPELIKLAQSNHSRMRRFGRIVISMIYIAAFGSIIYGIIYAQEHGNTSLATGMGFLGAATVVALQNFIASFFTYIYISITNQYDHGDIIKIGDPRMTSIGEVLELGIFSTIIKELDHELLFTGRQFTLPNNIFFTT
jgi:small-conductance mechanosensitive channel